MLFPLLYTISVAFMPSSELYTMALNILPKHPTLENFVNAFTKRSASTICPELIFGCGMHYARSDYNVFSCGFCLLFPGFQRKKYSVYAGHGDHDGAGEATIISNYLTVGSWGMLDTYLVLILPYLTSAMGIFLFRQFYMTFPVSLYESAKLDGCGNLRFIVKILIPLTKSAIGAMAVYTFINAWNMYMWPLLVTGSNKSVPFRLVSVCWTASILSRSL